MTTPPAEPVCGRTFDQFVCPQTGPHLCRPRVLHVLAFFRELCQHTKGSYARMPFEPAQWQREEILTPLFGQVVWEPAHSAYVRRYRTLYLFLPRRQGKSELLAAISLYCLCSDGEEGAEVYGLAMDREQASLVWRIAARMVRLSPVLSRNLQVVPSAGRIVYERTGSFFTTAAGDAAGALGTNVHCGYVDELLTQPSRDLYDAVRTSMGNRTQPLLMLATTAESDPGGFAAAEREWSMRVLADPDLDPQRLVVARYADPDDDWTDPAVWAKANPAMGDFLSQSTLAAECAHAKHNPAAERAFRQFRLNQPTRQVGRAVALPAWDDSAGPVDWRALPTVVEGQTCGAGLDLASTSDLAAYALCFPHQDGWRVLWRHFTPEAALPDLDRRTGGDATVWANTGVLTVTPGNVIDYNAIIDALAADRDRYDITTVAYDRWGATQLATQLTDDGWPLVAMGQGFASLAAPTRELLRAIGAGILHHGGHPLARWQASNVILRTDAAGNVKFDKGRSPEKVDGMVAAVMALDVVIRDLAAPDYATGGFA